jgi:plasmid stabilization system protein ParE
MVNRVVFTPTSLRELNSVISYLRNEVSSQAGENFINLIEKQVVQLESNLMDGRPVTARKTIRFVLVGKYHRLYYRKHGLTLYITRLFDTRQDPDKRPY